MKKDKFIMIRVNASQKELLLKSAKYFGMKVSEYILYRCNVPYKA